MKILRFLCLVLLPVLMGTSGEFLLKHSINTHTKNTPITTSQTPIKTPPIHGAQSFIAITLITLGGILWIVAMSKYELSFIYPYLSINYISIVVGSQWILGETVEWTRYLSVIFIILGLVLISRSPNSEVEIKEKLT